MGFWGFGVLGNLLKVDSITGIELKMFTICYTFFLLWINSLISFTLYKN